MTPEELSSWMSKVNTRTLELILLVSDKPEWYTQMMINEIQRRRTPVNPFRTDYDSTF